MIMISMLPGLQAIAYTLQNSYKELGLLIFLICISGFIFASLAYFIEIDEDSGFTSIPTAFYWVVITMTTIGYGDIHPTTGQLSPPSTPPQFSAHCSVELSRNLSFTVIESAYLIPCLNTHLA